MIKNINLGVIGIDHGHIFDMLDEMLKEGCTCDYFWTEGSPLTLKEFNQKYPNIKRVENKSQILNDNKIDMILISSIPKDRANNSIEALKSGKDVMVDKPGCTTLDQLEDLKRTVKQTGKIWSVNFSERFHVAAVAKAEQLVTEGKIGEVKHLDCRDDKLPYFRNLINDVLNRSETACSQELTYLTMELAIKAQEMAEKK